MKHDQFVVCNHADICTVNNFVQSVATIDFASHHKAATMTTTMTVEDEVRLAKQETALGQLTSDQIPCDVESLHAKRKDEHEAFDTIKKARQDFKSDSPLYPGSARQNQSSMHQTLMQTLTVLLKDHQEEKQQRQQLYNTVLSRFT